MNAVFADSFYFFALLNPKDSAHAKALDYSSRNSLAVVTTTWILTEIADGLSRSPNRRVFGGIVSAIRTNPANQIVKTSDQLFERGRSLYESRPDKEWSLTDCISFVVMRDLTLREALTGDKHFEQSGFIALLK